MTIPQVPAAAASLSAGSEAKPKNAAEAAKQFEALLIAQMLRSARETAASDDEDQTSETMFDLAGQHFAELLANNGGLGLAKIITKGLAATPQANPAR